jgi:23S rRNA (uracil1939-C5)-methyltransferase
LQVIAKNDIKTGTVVDLTHEGHGVVKIDRFPIFIQSTTVPVLMSFLAITCKILPPKGTG